MTGINIILKEWASTGPKDDPQLRGFSFGKDERARQLAAALTESGRLEILELAQGLHIQTNAYVGRVALGPLQLTIKPKIGGNTLLRLFQYAYRLRHLHFLPTSTYGIDDLDFQDLLLYQLLSEAKELLARGLHRTYVQRDDWLANPQGRLDFQRYVRAQGEVAAAQPPKPVTCALEEPRKCQHTPQSERATAPDDRESAGHRPKAGISGGGRGPLQMAASRRGTGPKDRDQYAPAQPLRGSRGDRTTRPRSRGWPPPIPPRGESPRPCARPGGPARGRSPAGR